MTSGLQQKDLPLFQVINQLIDVTDKSLATISKLSSSSSSSSGSGSGGNNNDSWSVLTNGDLVAPELIFAGGNVIMLHILG